jgi:hypothetical protein
MQQPIAYSLQASETFAALDKRVSRIFDEVQKWRGWIEINEPTVRPERILSIIREVFRSVAMYQSFTTEAGFHMLGRLPKGEVKLIQALCSHKAEEAEHGLWAVEDYLRLGGERHKLELPPTPATFAVAAVWWRMAEVEDPLGYLGAEYLFEQLTMLVTQALVPILRRHDLSHSGLRFAIEHATEDARHAVFIKHLLLDTVTRYPTSADSMLRCFDYFHAVYPLQVWDEAYLRA